MHRFVGQPLSILHQRSALAAVAVGLAGVRMASAGMAVAAAEHSYAGQC